MLKGLVTLFKFIGLPDMSEYEIQERPTRKQPKIKKSLEEKADDFGFVGQWKDDKHYEARNVHQTKAAKREGLDSFDEAYLNEYCKGWAKTEQTRHRSRQIKELWTEGKSAREISKIKTIGLSERSLDYYVKAFRLADERREQEGGERLRKD